MFTLSFENKTWLINSHICYSVQIGWPTSLPSNEKDAFIKRVLKEKVYFNTMS